jgi:serine/threonine protein kinase
MGKYDPLRDYLAARIGSEVRMAFGDIEKLVGKLPASARKHRAWWANDSKVEAKAWRAAGWRVQSVHQTAEVVVFVRGAADRAWAPNGPTSDDGAGRAAGSVGGEQALGAAPDHRHLVRSVQPLVREGSLFAERYRVKHLLGGGERKQTYLAWDIKGRRDVALAIVAKGADPRVTEREVEILGQVAGGPNIVRFIDWDLAQDEQYLVFEYLSGGDLLSHCRRSQEQGVQMPLPEFFQRARQLCRALGHIHKRGIIHRDVSMSNILLNERGDVHLGDFDTAVSPNHPASGQDDLSTYEGYAAPELLSGAAIDARADIYSLGAVLYEALTGAMPPASNEPSAPIAAPSKIRGDIPAGLDRLILSMLAPERDDRPVSTSTLPQAFRDIERRVSDLESLIANGESDTVEFKSSLRVGVRDGGIIKVLEQVVVKSVAGFLNGHGGTLLIGVADDGTVVGLNNDYHSSPKIGGPDGFERKLRELLSSAMGRAVQTFVTVTFHSINGHDICRVAVEPSDHPVYVKDEGKTKLFLRTGNATNELPVDEAIKYYLTRWSKSDPIRPKG